ncbi:MAG TPA: Rrf2 family transcriptional regulator [Nevskia sp.]|nr:Rrf2 family transcriptional regulator [Nevskia sp.]
MRLTCHTDYSLRLLMLLALEPGRLHTIEEVASRYGVSRNHLMKVALTLARGGFVESVRGRGGGLRLARPAAAIGVGAVVRATEDNFDIVECFDQGGNNCSVTSACRLKRVLHEAVSDFLKALDRHTLADLVASPAASRRMRQLLPVSVVSG